MHLISKFLHFFVPWREPHRLVFNAVFLSVTVLVGEGGLALASGSTPFVLGYGAGAFTSLFVEMYMQRTSEKRASE